MSRPVSCFDFLFLKAQTGSGEIWLAHWKQSSFQTLWNSAKWKPENRLLMYILRRWSQQKNYASFVDNAPNMALTKCEWSGVSKLEAKQETGKWVACQVFAWVAVIFLRRQLILLVLTCCCGLYGKMISVKNKAVQHQRHNPRKLFQKKKKAT